MQAEIYRDLSRFNRDLSGRGEIDYRRDSSLRKKFHPQCKLMLVPINRDKGDLTPFRIVGLTVYHCLK